MNALRPLLIPLAVAVTAPGLAHAQSMIDPTRPPMLAAPATTRADAPMRAASSAPPPLPQVQAVQLPRDGAASALVDGKLVRAGERVGGQTVVAIDARGVTLRSARGTTQLLSLFSGVTKTPSVAGTSAPGTDATALAASSRKETR